MTIEYKRIPTTYAVYNAILTQHWNLKPELCQVSVFESFTDIVENGVSTIYTVWGFKNSEVALVGARTTYNSCDGEEEKDSRAHEYWLCAPYWEEE